MAIVSAMTEYSCDHNGKRVEDSVEVSTQKRGWAEGAAARSSKWKEKSHGRVVPAGWGKTWEGLWKQEWKLCHNSRYGKKAHVRKGSCQPFPRCNQGQSAEQKAAVAGGNT